MNSYYIKLADKTNGLWSVEDRGPKGSGGTVTLKVYTTKRVIIKCPSFTFTQGINAHYLVAEGKIESFTPNETVIV